MTKPSLLLLSLSFIFFSAVGQGAKQNLEGLHTESIAGLQIQTFLIPPYPKMDTNEKRFIAPGKVFKTVIKNNSLHAAMLYPFLNRAGMEHIAMGDSFLLAYLFSQVKNSALTDTDAIRLKLVTTVAEKLEKTDLFTHGQVLYYAADGNLFAKQNSLMGALAGNYQKQCGDYVSNATAILMKTGFFDYSDIRVVQLADHMACEFLYHGGWVFVDFDPMEPVLLVRDSANANGFASASDIRDNRALVTDAQQYFFVDEAGHNVNLCSKQTMKKYRDRFNSVSTSPVRFANEPVSISSQVVLPANASMLSEYITPYVLGPTSFLELSKVFAESPRKTYPVLAEILGVTLDSAIAIVSANQIAINCSTKNWRPDYWGITPTLKIVLPPTTDTTRLGSDINFPGYILSSTLDIHLPQAIFQRGNKPKLWTHGPNTGEPVADNDVNYLVADGYIAPHPNSSDTISVSFNPRVINFGEGFKVGCLKGESFVVNVFSNDTLISGFTAPNH